MPRRDEPPEERPPDEPIRCRHCGEVDPDDHGDGCPQVRAEELAEEQPVPEPEQGKPRTYRPPEEGGDS